MKLPSGVTQGVTPSGLDYLVVDHPLAQARIYLQGAHICQYQAAGAAPLLWVSEAEDYRPGKPIRGGVPICWPWFGAHPSESNAPAHGFVRAAKWHCDQVSSNAAGVTLSFRFEAKSRADWPHQALLGYQVHVGKELSLTLTTTNTGKTQFQLTQALHSYFAINDIDHLLIHGLAHSAYDDQLLGAKGRGLTHTSDTLSFDREIDRIYYPVNPIRMVARNFSLSIEAQGSASAVIWNPWREKSKRLSNFQSTDYRAMVCVETANCGNDTVSLEPGQSHALSVKFKPVNTGKN